jgi:hypothetical protein
MLRHRVPIHETLHDASRGQEGRSAARAIGSLDQWGGDPTVASSCNQNALQLIPGSDPQRNAAESTNG